MDTIIAVINALSCSIVALGLISAVLSRRVYDGVIVKVGLCSMALGFICVALHMLKIGQADLQGLARAMLLINSGIAVVIIGYLLRARRLGHKMRRVSDWANLYSLGDDEAAAKG